MLDGLERAGVGYWVAGGWGVAALVGRQTREHRDLDLAVDTRGLAQCLDALEGLGYVRETDWLPVRVEYAAAGRGWVDVHPVEIFAEGHGRQRGMGGHDFVYPASCWAVDRLGGRRAPCLSAEQQRVFHSGYAPRPEDVHDLAQLDALGC